MRTWLLALALTGCHREPTREQVVAPIYRDHRPLPEIPGLPVVRCPDVPTIVLSGDAVHVDATALGAPLPWAKRRDALPDAQKLDWPLATLRAARLNDGLYPLGDDHELRALRDVLGVVAALRAAFPSEEKDISAILTLGENVPIETTARTYFEVAGKLGNAAVATAAGCVTGVFARVADGGKRVRIARVGDRYATTSCVADADGKIGHGPEQWTAEEIKTIDIGGAPELCAGPTERTLDVLTTYARILPPPLTPSTPLVVATRRP